MLLAAGDRPLPVEVFQSCSKLPFFFLRQLLRTHRPGFVGNWSCSRRQISYVAIGTYLCFERNQTVFLGRFVKIQASIVVSNIYFDFNTLLNVVAPYLLSSIPFHEGLETSPNVGFSFMRHNVAAEDYGCVYELLVEANSVLRGGSLRLVLLSLLLLLVPRGTVA